jgi:glyoxylase-like metal-dependent hydrolase (beta-lactamase superfamily II)
VTTTRRFGPYDVTILKDGQFEPPNDVLMHAGGETALKAAIDRLAGAALRLDVNCFLLRGDGGLILVDAGIGPAWGAAFGHARTALQALGVAPEQIGRVLLTHLHTDHALGLLDGQAAWLPRAEIFIPGTDLAYFTDAAVRAALPEDRQQPFDITAGLLAAYDGRITTIEAGEVPGLPGIELVPLPGHTPGHSGYLLYGPETLLLWADTVHVGDLQPGDPGLGLIFDVDPAQAMQTRLATFQMAEQKRWTVAGAHVTGFGRIERAGEAFRFAPV